MNARSRASWASLLFAEKPRTRFGDEVPPCADKRTTPANAADAAITATNWRIDVTACHRGLTPQGQNTAIFRDLGSDPVAGPTSR